MMSCDSFFLKKLKIYGGISYLSQIMSEIRSIFDLKKYFVNG